MFRAAVLRVVGEWSGEPADVVVLNLDERYRRRIMMKGVRGLAFLLDLSQAVTLRNGDGLVLDDGRIVEVVAAAEPLTEISAKDVATLIRIAWHLGNRHLQVQMVAKKLRIRRDPVIEDMVRILGAELTQIEAPFDPEGGAYSGGSTASHSHHHHHHSGHLDHDHAAEPVSYSVIDDRTGAYDGV
jgi:urease accessory protein